MIKEVYALYDKKAEQYGTPMFVPGLAVLLRDLRDELRRGDKGGMLTVHPEDFVLYSVGTFDDGSCVFTLLPRVAVVCEVVSLVELPAVE